MRRRWMSAILALTMALALTACGGDSSSSSNNDSTPAESTPAAPAVEIPPVEDLTGTDTSAIPGLEDGVLTVGMECAYAPYNWTQTDDSNGAVPISNVPGAYANGYDVMIAQTHLREPTAGSWRSCRSAWDSLCPAVQSGTMDANIAGQSMTADRMNEVDMAGPYYYATIVVPDHQGQPLCQTQPSIADLAGGTCTSQSGTIWYDSCLPQIENANLLARCRHVPPPCSCSSRPALWTSSAPICPPLMAAVAKVSDNLVILNFSGTDGDFQFATEEERAENVNIGISVQKGNTAAGRRHRQRPLRS